MVRYDQNCVGDQQRYGHVFLRQVSELMTPLAGIVSGFWIWNRKTVENWKRLCCCHRQKDEEKVYNLNSKNDIENIVNPVSNDCNLRSASLHYPV